MANNTRRLVLVVHNVRSAYNVGSLLRTADGLGLETVYLTGYTPYPEEPDDERPPHIRRKTSAAIAKTALGAEKTLDWRHYADIWECLKNLKADGFMLVALEQVPTAIDLSEFRSSRNVALIAGSEVSGLDEAVLQAVDTSLQIPMLGAKESLNVSIAAAMALYHLRYLDKYTA